jgi:hypothetical protein
MQQICLVMAARSGRGEDARAFVRELEESRKDDYGRCEERIGTALIDYVLSGRGPMCSRPSASIGSPADQSGHVGDRVDDGGGLDAGGPHGVLAVLARADEDARQPSA